MWAVWPKILVSVIWHHSNGVHAWKFNNNKLFLELGGCEPKILFCIYTIYFDLPTGFLYLCWRWWTNFSLTAVLNSSPVRRGERGKAQRTLLPPLAQIHKPSRARQEKWYHDRNSQKGLTQGTFGRTSDEPGQVICWNTEAEGECLCWFGLICHFFLVFVFSHLFCVELLSLCKEEIKKSKDVQKLFSCIAV